MNNTISVYDLNDGPQLLGKQDDTPENVAFALARQAEDTAKGRKIWVVFKNNNKSLPTTGGILA
jgi:hypothetical protein